MNEELIQAAMNIILHTGHTRAACMQALKNIEDADFEAAKENMKTANKEITEAHKIQTDAIQKDVGGEKPQEYSLLFAHAQDTLMTIYSEINIAKRLIKIFSVYEKRIAALEEK